MADGLTALLAANGPSGGRIFALVGIQAAVALGVFVHATRSGNRHALLWALGSLVFIAVAVLYVYKVWWNRVGRDRFAPRR